MQRFPQKANSTLSQFENFIQISLALFEDRKFVNLEESWGGTAELFSHIFRKCRIPNLLKPEAFSHFVNPIV